MKKIAILGSTGSIGTQTLDVVRANGDIEVAALSAGRNIKLLEAQIPRVSSAHRGCLGGDRCKGAQNGSVRSSGSYRGRYGRIERDSSL